MKKHFHRRAGKFALAALTAVLMIASGPALAGGFSRGEADTDILFSEGNYSLRTGAVYVSPGRTYSTLNGSPSSDEAYSDAYWMPNIGIKAALGSYGACALTYARPFGASATYGDDAQNAEAITAISQGLPLVNPTSKMSFTAEEYGATCDIQFDAGRGGFYLIGGVFLETFKYNEDTWFGSVRLKDDSGFGYRMGVAYDIPEYAMRFQLMYRSEVEHDAEGTFTPSALAIAAGVTSSLPTVGGGTLPQSIKLSAQSGVAPGWLVYGSVMWTDWSVLPDFRYDVSNLASSNKIFNYEDGYTVQIGVGHEFNENLSGTVNLTWDRGVGTGADITTDSWTVGFGGEYKTDLGTFGLGGAVSYLTKGSQSEASGATYNATADADWVAAIGISYSVGF
ncbi:OmpP1/FadL family transporter [Rhizobium leguminosarum]|uniref:OmpP1/FadL family transporter n=1 Tax=Rhizobium leguminosarum TaxID=384 RepID=UPI001AE3A903|nr:outer membrane protein transport protein [Rhizobium leguminosarum]MBP2449094.1 long-chain fatty acid transport protein [Rhizobium leguminosarum]